MFEEKGGGTKNNNNNVNYIAIEMNINKIEKKTIIINNNK